MRIAVQLECVSNALCQFLCWTASCHHVADAAVQRKIQHALHDGRACRVTHIRFNFAHVMGFVRFVDAKAFAKGEEIFAPSLLSNTAHARVLGIFGVKKILYRFWWHIKGWV